MNSLANTSKIICDILTIWIFFSASHIFFYSTSASYFPPPFFHPLLKEWRDMKTQQKKIAEVEIKIIASYFFRKGILISFTYASQWKQKTKHCQVKAYFFQLPKATFVSLSLSLSLSLTHSFVFKFLFNNNPFSLNKLDYKATSTIYWDKILINELTKCSFQWSFASSEKPTFPAKK
jgi:hypothetical protein